MKRMEREVLQDIVMRFRYINMPCKYKDEMCAIADELIMKNARLFVPENIMDKVSKGSKT